MLTMLQAVWSQALWGVANCALLLLINGNLVFGHVMWFRACLQTQLLTDLDPFQKPSSQSQPICQHAHFCQHVHLCWHTYQFLSKRPCFRAAAARWDKHTKQRLPSFPICWLAQILFLSEPNPSDSQISSQGSKNWTHHVALILLQASTLLV